MILPTLLLATCLPLADDADRITAADVAAAPVFAALPPETPLGYAPLPGARRIFPIPELERLARRYGASLVPRAEVCIERVVAPLDPARLLAAMRNSLGVPEARLELVEYSRYPAPRGAIEFARADLAPPPAAQAQAPVLWKGSVRYGAGRRFAIWARVRILVQAECWLAARSLAAGRPIESGQLRQGTYEGFPLAEAPVLSLGQAAGHVLRRAIPAGAPVPLGALDPPYDISRGETVQVNVASGEAHLKLDARAEADGRVGQIIPVLNLASGKRFPARIAGPGKVVVGVQP